MLLGKRGLHMQVCVWSIIEGLMVGGLMVLSTPAVAQVSYTVLPAVQSDIHAQEYQPTKRAVPRVTLVVKDSTVRYVVNDLLRQAHLKMIYDNTLPQLDRRITVRIEKSEVMDALGVALRGTGLQAKLASDGETVMLQPREYGHTTDSTRANGSVKGTVTDSASRKGVAGATVAVQGTKLSTLTSETGAFELRNVPEGKQVLTIKEFGYRPVVRTVTVASEGHVTMHVVLVPTATMLSGMVTTATGIQQRREVGNDIVTLNVDSIQRIAPISSVTDLLETRVPGLTVLRSSGTPGDPARLRLRGAGSINGNNDPIVIVDGIRIYAAQSDPRTANLAKSTVASTSQEISQGGNTRGVTYAAPSPLDQIDPNSIETIEVLKGPSASSLYGSDAANGVIIITTKKGQVGPARWVTTLNQVASYYPGKYPEQIIRWGHNDQEGGIANSYNNFPNAICSITSSLSDVTGCNTLDSVTHLQVLNLPRWSPVGHGTATNGSATVSGGVSALTYSLTGSIGTNLGYLRLPEAMADAFQTFHGYAAPGWAKQPDRYTTWSGSGQFTTQVKPTLRFTLNSMLFHGLQRRSSLDQILPLLERTIDTVKSNVYGYGNSVPVQNANAYERASDEQLTFNNVLSASWEPWSWLPLTGTAGLNIGTGHDVSFLARDIVPYAKAVYNRFDTLGYYSVGQKNTLSKTINVNATIPGWRGRLNTAVGFNVYTQSTTDLTGHQDTLEVGVTRPATFGVGSTQAVTGTTTFGWFFEPRFTLSERFYLTPGFRLDGGTANGGSASVSGLPSKLSLASLFPKINFSWVALDRQDADAHPLFGVLTLLRPRLALGSAGVQPKPGDRLRLLGEDVDAGLAIQTLGNTQLRPERSLEVEGGADIDAWHGRVTLEVTHSRKQTHDAIIGVPVAPSVYGEIGNININIGEILNTSTELSMSIHPIETGLVSWTIGGNWSRNDNEVLSLNQGSLGLTQVLTTTVGQTNSIRIDALKIAVGYPLFGRWAMPILGYADVNHDGILQVNEIRLGDTAVFLGRQDPAETEALNTDISLFHGRFGVHANFAHQGAYSQLNAAAGSGTFLSVANDSSATLGQQASYVAAAYYDATAGREGSQIGLAQTVSYWRFQSLSLNYEVPVTIAQRFRVHRMSIALQGSNLALWTNYRGKDPDVNAFPNGNGTVDGGQLPQPRTWSLHLILGN